MAIINNSNGNYIKVMNVIVSVIDDYVKSTIIFRIYKNREQRLSGPAEFETYYEKQIELNDFVFTDEYDSVIRNLKSGAYYTLRKYGYDISNWEDD